MYPWRIIPHFAAYLFSVYSIQFEIKIEFLVAEMYLTFVWQVFKHLKIFFLDKTVFYPSKMFCRHAKTKLSKIYNFGMSAGLAVNLLIFVIEVLFIFEAVFLF